MTGKRALTLFYGLQLGAAGLCQLAVLASIGAHGIRRVSTYAFTALVCAIVPLAVACLVAEFVVCAAKLVKTKPSLSEGQGRRLLLLAATIIVAGIGVLSCLSMTGIGYVLQPCGVPSVIAFGARVPTSGCLT